MNPTRTDKTANDHDCDEDARLEKENQGYNQHGHGKGGKLGEGEPEGEPERGGTTQPDFGQAGTYGRDPEPGK